MKVGDAMVKLTAGNLRSNIHRPPGAQGRCTTQSLGYFCRLENDVATKRLKGGIVDEV